MEGDDHVGNGWSWMNAGSVAQHTEGEPQPQQAHSEPQGAPEGEQEPASSSQSTKPSPWGDWETARRQWEEEQRRVNPSPFGMKDTEMLPPASEPQEAKPSTFASVNSVDIVKALEQYKDRSLESEGGVRDQ